jgi:hypothetical protein
LTYFLNESAEDEILAAMEEDEEMSYSFCDDRMLSFYSLESEELEYVSYCMDPQPDSHVALDLPGRRIFYESTKTTDRLPWLQLVKPAPVTFFRAKTSWLRILARLATFSPQRIG